MNTDDPNFDAIFKKDTPRIQTKDLRSFAFLLSFARPWKARIIFSLVLLTCASIFGVLSARLLGFLIQQGLVEKSQSAAFRFGAGVLGFELLGVGVAYWGRKLLAEGASSTVLAIREKLFSRLSDLPMSYFDKQPLGRIVTRMTYDVEGLEEFFSGTLARLLAAMFSLLAALTAMLLTDFRLGSLLVIAIVPAIIATWAFRNPLRYWNREFAIRNSAINAKLSELLNGIPVIRAFGAEKWSQDKFDNVVNKHLVAAIKINVLNSYARPIVLILCQLPLMGLLWFGGGAVIQGALALGLFVTFVRYCERFSRPISALAQEIHTIQVAFTSAERIVSFLNEASETEVLGLDGAKSLQEESGEIVFDNVWMSYAPNNFVLKGINFKISAGEKIGLAGSTGSGKTSTISLISRLYEFQKGEVLLNGSSIREFKRQSLRDRIGFISQDVVLFRGSVKENLCSGRNFSNDLISEAMAQTHLDQILAKSGRDLNSQVLDQGANFSMGERQLLALTRVLLKNPILLVMDEATANIDPELEDILHLAVATVMKNRSCLMIAHRLSTLKDCDRILVFRNGEIEEQGTHQELLEQKGYYSELLHSHEAAQNS